MKPVHLRRVAHRDLRLAAAWYRERDSQLADRFLDEVYRTLAVLERLPDAGGPVFGSDDPDVPQLPVDNFPYQVIFRKQRHRTEVLAIAHERKKPGYWNE